VKVNRKSKTLLKKDVTVQREEQREGRM